jgi:hypothetical protein
VALFKPAPFQLIDDIYLCMPIGNKKVEGQKKQPTRQI